MAMKVPVHKINRKDFQQYMDEGTVRRLFGQSHVMQQSLLQINGVQGWRKVVESLLGRLVQSLGADKQVALHELWQHETPYIGHGGFTFLENGVVGICLPPVETKRLGGTYHSNSCVILVASTQEGVTFLETMVSFEGRIGDGVSSRDLYLHFIAISHKGISPRECLDLPEQQLNAMGLPYEARDVFSLEEKEVFSVSRDAMWKLALMELYEQIGSMETVLNNARQAIETANTKLQGEADRTKSIERKHARQIESLESDIETQKAIATRHRNRADEAERQLRELRGLASGAAAASVEAAVREAVATLEEKNRELEQRLEHADIAALENSDEINRLRADNKHLNDDLNALLAGPTSNDAVTEKAPEPLPHPDHLDDLDKWADDHLHGRVVVVSKAAKAARKSTFANPRLVYRTLKALASAYWPMRFTKDMDKKDEWSGFLTEEGLTNGPVGNAVTQHRYSDAYYAPWHNRRVLLDRHIQGSNNRTEELCFRLYYHVDTERQVIVVGHLPTHLPNIFE